MKGSASGGWNCIATREADWFDEQERDYKLEIAEGPKPTLEVARDGGDWLASLEEVFRLQSYNLTSWRLNAWLREWAAVERDLGSVL